MKKKKKKMKTNREEEEKEEDQQRRRRKRRDPQTQDKNSSLRDLRSTCIFSSTSDHHNFELKA